MTNNLEPDNQKHYLRSCMNRKIIGVDFDDTLATSEVYPIIGEPIQEVIDYVKNEQRKGAYLILITMREGKVLDEAVKWCRKHGLKFDAVNDNIDFRKEYFENNPRKIFCHEYIDDRNVGGIEFILQELKRKREENND